MFGHEESMAPDDDKDDNDLIQSYYACDDAAFEELVGRYRKRLFAFFRGLGFSYADADELTQDTLTRVCLTKDKPDAQFNPAKGELDAWLLRIAYRVACDAWRRKQPTMVSTEELAVEGTSAWEPADRGPDAEQQAAANELLDALAACLNELSRMEHAVVVLVIMRGLSSAEAGQILGTSEDAVNTALNRARNKLPECMKSKGYESVDPRESVDPQALRQAMAERGDEFLVQLGEDIVVRCRRRQR